MPPADAEQTPEGEMRAVTFVLTPPDGARPAHRFGPEADLARERIYNINVLEDGTVVLLGRLRGDLERAGAFMEADADILGFNLVETGEGGLVYVRTRPPRVIKRFMQLPERHEILFDLPIEGTRDGGLRIVMIARSDEVLQDALADVPEEMSVSVERIGAYPAESGTLDGLLTGRQREVLDAALDLGYYEVPREATHADVAERLGLSVGTVGEHLQKIEARVFHAL